MDEITAKQAGLPVAEKAGQYTGIDLIKFCCAIMVFIIHIPPFLSDAFYWAGSLNFCLQSYFCRLAVPFYFVSSGFLLFRKMPLYELKPDVIKTYCYKNLRLLGVWTAILVIGETGHLWYLSATVVAVAILSLCLRARMRLRNIWALALVLYFIGLFGDAYFNLNMPLVKFVPYQYLFQAYFRVFKTTRNGVFMGFMYVLMGATFAQRKIKGNQSTVLLGFVGSMLCLLVEAVTLKYFEIPIRYNIYIFLPVAVYFLFSFACGLRLKDRPIYKRLRTMGVVIYFTHLLIDEIACFAISAAGSVLGMSLSGYRFAVSLLCTLLFSIVVERISCKEKFKWLTWLWS